MELYELTLHELGEKLQQRECSSLEAAQSVLKRIRSVEDRVKSFLTLTEDAALAQARAADQRIAQGGDFPPLLGIPLALKDIFLTEGIRTTCGSRILENFIPTFDGTATAKVKQAGAVILGKLNQDEFAMGSSTERSAFGPTRNPWDLERIPGGSSGGSAAAVAAGECIAALGTDTGGSIRQPAACCGVVGIKPTYGRVSRFGIIAFASSLDQVGPITRDVTDAAILLQAVAGYDPRDSTSVNLPVPDYRQSLLKDTKGMTVGIPKEYFVAGLDPEIEAATRQAIQQIEGLGAKAIEVSLPHTEYSIACYYIIAPAEASSNLARYDGVRYGLRAPAKGGILQMYKATRDQGFGPEVKRRILIGTYTLSAGYYDAYYRKAQQVRTLIKQDFDRAFAKCDVLLTPTMPFPAFKLGEKTDDPLQMYLSDIFTLSCNLAGLPGLSLPCGFTKSGLPIGLQILGPHFQEEKIFRAAYAYEQATEWHLRRPAL
jgi:aspartyl-tRNA(Asn)/glutamyl-tRNA(Gln) amidotransferase subunit A